MHLSRKLLLSAAAVAAAASIAGLGTYATFTGTTSASHTVSSGTLTIALGTAGGTANRLTIGASNIVPGDSLQRRVDLTNSGNVNLAAITLTTTAGSNNLLSSDATNGLQMKIERCSGTLGWRESATTPYTYTCDSLTPGDNLGTRASVLAQRAIVGSSLALTGMNALTAGGSDDMVLTTTLPSTADNTFQSLSNAITYTFNATQRAAAAQ
jgi:spore coat-associated protein N